MAQPTQAGVRIGLSAVVMALRDRQAVVLTTPAEDGGRALPFGPFDPVRDRTFERALRDFVTAQTGFRLGFVEQLYTFGDAGRGAPRAAQGPERQREVSVGYLALTRTDAENTERLAEAGAAHQAWLPGDRSDVAQLLPQFDIFALPSQAEGISNTLLEAMACGCAPVATDVGGNPELVEHEANGLLVPAQDSTALATALARLVNEPALRERLAQASLARVRAQFSLDGMIAAYGALYASAA